MGQRSSRHLFKLNMVVLTALAPFCLPQDNPSITRVSGHLKNAPLKEAADLLNSQCKNAKLVFDEEQFQKVQVTVDWEKVPYTQALLELARQTKTSLYTGESWDEVKLMAWGPMRDHAWLMSEGNALFFMDYNASKRRNLKDGTNTIGFSGQLALILDPSMRAYAYNAFEDVKVEGREVKILPERGIDMAPGLSRRSDLRIEDLGESDKPVKISGKTVKIVGKEFETWTLAPGKAGESHAFGKMKLEVHELTLGKTKKEGVLSLNATLSGIPSVFNPEKEPNGIISLLQGYLTANWEGGSVEFLFSQSHDRKATREENGDWKYEFIMEAKKYDGEFPADVKMSATFPAKIGLMGFDFEFKDIPVW